MNHKNKVKLARKLRSQEEIKKKTPIFQTKNWEARKEAISKKVKNRELKSKKPNK